MILYKISSKIVLDFVSFSFWTWSFGDWKTASFVIHIAPLVSKFDGNVLTIKGKDRPRLFKPRTSHFPDRFLNKHTWQRSLKKLIHLTEVQLYMQCVTFRVKTDLYFRSLEKYSLEFLHTCINWHNVTFLRILNQLYISTATN